MKFFLKTKKNEGKAALFFEVNKRTPKIKVQICTNVPVSIQAWNTANESAKNLQKYISTKEGASVMNLLNQIENAVNNLFSLRQIHGAEDKPIIENAVNEIAFAEERKRTEEQENREREEREEKERKEKNKYKDILVFVRAYIEDMTEGRARTKNGKKYNSAEIRSYKALYKLICEYMESRTERTWEDISPIFANGFSQFLMNKDYMVSTISHNLSLFRTICRLSAKYGYNNNLVSLQMWNSPQPTREDKKTAIYLTEEELKALYEMPLLGTRATVRDIFFVGAMIAQRWSDYSRIEKSMFHEFEGVLFLTLTQQKTHKEVVIPITDERVIKTLQRYDYTFPLLSRCWFSVYIKEICHELSNNLPSMREQYETQPSKWERENTPERINPEGKIIKYKWEMAASHTARRAGVTNMYKSGVLDKREMMSITGHSTDKIFEEYIKLSAMEQAKRIADKLKTTNTRKGNKSNSKNA